jgi:hypothetical protein
LRTTELSIFSYYAEEKTLAAPSLTKKPMGGGDKLYGRDLREYEDKDIESLLSKLTTEELEGIREQSIELEISVRNMLPLDLNSDFDPDVWCRKAGGFS